MAIDEIIQRTLPPTGLGQGDVLADDKLFSLSSGNSTDDIRIFRALSSLRLCTGLDGAGTLEINVKHFVNLIWYS